MDQLCRRITEGKGRIQDAVAITDAESVSTAKMIRGNKTLCGEFPQVVFMHEEFAVQLRQLLQPGPTLANERVPFLRAVRSAGSRHRPDVRTLVDTVALVARRTCVRENGACVREKRT